MTSTDFLIIEPFLRDAIQARTLQAAFELGIIDTLESTAGLSESQLLRGRACDAAGGRFLFQILAKSGVVNLDGESIQLTETFRSALRFRDLLKFNETTLKNLPLHEELLDWIHTAPNPIQKSA